eukprot:scaffold454539_cov14-Prasinocladus_malaysianus.AAC.1
MKNPRGSVALSGSGRPHSSSTRVALPVLVVVLVRSANCEHAQGLPGTSTSTSTEKTIHRVPLARGQFVR